ncbi:unnamed protein product [Brugia timori]|uniref:Ovule protein n=1 Tax=Brugia timori TaxID=42155 RepID=A0A0R3Q8U0_9BILA|nr:unnamed protein product [Brugia timori]
MIICPHHFFHLHSMSHISNFSLTLISCISYDNKKVAQIMKNSHPCSVNFSFTPSYIYLNKYYRVWRLTLLCGSVDMCKNYRLIDVHLSCMSDTFNFLVPKSGRSTFFRRY